MGADLPQGSAQAREMRVSLAPAAVLKTLVAIIILFGILHLAAMPVYIQGMKAADGVHVRVARFLMLQNERTIPTWFSIVLIASNIALLALNAVAARQSRTGSALPWLMLAAIFTFLSMDEMLVLHERVGSAIGRSFDLDGVLSFPWVITGSIFSAAVALAFLGFLRRLPRRTAGLFVLSGAIFVGAALGIEMVEAWTTSAIGWGSLFYLEVLVEETMEMFGQALFGYALLDYLAQSRTCLVLSAEPMQPSAQTAVATTSPV